MFTKLLASATVALGLGIAVPASAQQVTAQVPIDSSFVGGELTWGSSLGTVAFRWKPVVIKNTLMLCGAVTNSNARMARHNATVLNKGWLKVDGRKVVRGLRFFKVHQAGTSLEGAVANCTPVKASTKQNSKYELGFDSTRVRL